MLLGQYEPTVSGLLGTVIDVQKQTLTYTCYRC